MNKLGFAIKSASGGAGNLFECNKDVWTNKVVDIRDYQKLFNGLSGSGKFITFLSFDENGSFLVQLRTIAGRKNDFLSGWIYIPNEIEIIGKDIEEAHDYVRQILCLSSIPPEKQDEINAHFAKEFPIKEAFSKNVPSCGEKFGYRELGHFSMKEILDFDMYQQYYDGYKAIFLMEKDTVSISDEYAAHFTDFTSRELEKYCVLMPPQKHLLGFDTQIYDRNGNVFNSPLRVKQGDTVQLSAIREGFEKHTLPPIPIRKEVEDFPFKADYKINWEKRVNARMFRVVNQEGKELKNATIKIFDTDISYHEAVLPEAKVRNAYVSINADGYEGKKGTIDLLAQGLPIKIVMERRVVTQPMWILLSNGREAEMTLSSKGAIGKNPLIGYCYDRDQRMLVPDSLYKWKQRLIGFAVCIAIIILVGFMYSFNSWLDSHELRLGIPPWKEINMPAENTENNNYAQDVPSDDQKAVVPPYLDKKTTWNKDSLESHEETKGLFDALNEFDFYKVKEYEGKLGNSKNFMKIIDKIKEIEGKGFNPMEGKETNGGKYNPENDKRIDIYNYIKWISSSHVQTYTKSESEKPTGNPIKSDKIKKGATKSEQSTVKKKDVKPKRGGED